MTDEERYPPPYESDAVTSFRKRHLTSRESIRSGGLEFHRHYAGSTACTPSRATLFTGQYPSLHGVTSTDGAAKQATDPDMQLARPRLGAHTGRLVPRRRVPDPLQGKMARLARRPGRPGDPRFIDGVRRCRKADSRGRRGLQEGRPARPVRILGVDRPGAPRCGQVRLRHGARRRLRRAGCRAVRRAGPGPPRRPVAGGRIVRQPARHRLQRLRVGAVARVRAAGRHGARHPRGAVRE